jgi:hypothetical protein
MLAIFRLRFLVTIFLGAFLLFQVQPMIGRYVLPWFGGGPMVWTTCMLFFQVLLVAGYAYAHWLGTRPNVRMQTIIHITVLLVSLLFLPVNPRAAIGREAPGQDPSVRILLTLAFSIGVPYLILAATSPLLQRWFAISQLGESPWRLYSLSNTGSFLALLSYPFVVEPFLGLAKQSYIWSALYGAFALLCGWTAWSMRTQKMATVARVGQCTRTPRAGRILFWIGLAACGSMLLLGTTNILCQNIGPIAFLWVAPLSIYLLTFVLAFAGDQWYRPSVFAICAGILAPVCCLMAVGHSFGPYRDLALYLIALFISCMLCHGELAHSRPQEEYLTVFYLAVAAGGALGGIFVALISPHIFVDFKEYAIGIAGACTLALIGWVRAGALKEARFANLGVRISLTALAIGGLAGIITAASNSNRGSAASWRNFYGILRVKSHTSAILGPYRELSNGYVMHGAEYFKAPQREWPVTYFGPHSGIGLALQSLTKPNRRVGVIGLGAGTLAAWGRPGDTFRFYDINPDVIVAANAWFDYLKDSKARVEVVSGDARVELEHELRTGRAQQFDVLAVDAFSGDAIPLHLLSSECADLYRSHLASGGVLLFHISTWFLDLNPVLRGMASHLGWNATQLLSGDSPSTGENGSTWVLISPQPLDPVIARLATPWGSSGPAPILWTDDFSSLTHILRF